MSTVGLITEYNPFHNGHLHHLRESLKMASAEVAVAVMSGHFLQRGEPALVDKWTRTEMALAAGVDLVVELPLPWACSSAPDFARGGVQAISALGGVDAFCFGSETGELAPLLGCAEWLCEQEPEVKIRTADLLRQGKNYPQARAELLADCDCCIDAAALAAPNNILGIEYLKALKQTGSALEPLTIRRIGAGYHDLASGPDRIASATGIRQRLAEGQPVGELMPEGSYAILHRALQKGRYFSPRRYLQLLQGQIFRDSEGLEDFWLVEDGLEQRLIDQADQAATLEELISSIKVRQLTRTRVQRALVSVLLGLRQATIRPLLAASPRYLHLLGASPAGRKYISASRRQRQVPLVQNFSRIYAQLKRHYGRDSASYRQALEQLELELRATRMYSLLLHQFAGGSRNQDFYEPLIRCDEPQSLRGVSPPKR
jgi:predicted nucleotidyltransferase